MKLVYVEWVDSCGPNGWTELNDIDDRIAHIRSVGWVWLDTPESLTLVPHYEPDRYSDKPYQGKGIVSIPKRAVTRVVEIAADGNVGGGV